MSRQTKMDRRLTRRRHADGLASVRLTRKLADVIDGIDITEAHVGDRLNIPPHDADLLIAEGWAERAPRRVAQRRTDDVRSVAPDTPLRSARR